MVSEGFEEDGSAFTTRSNELRWKYFRELEAMEAAF